jgi:VWFA-related protein
MVSRHLRDVFRVLALTLVFLGAGQRVLPGVPAPQNLAPAAAAAVVTIDIVALDRDGKAVDTLGAANFAVTVDGKPRRVLWARYVSRGPGSSADAAARQPNRNETLTFAAEPARNVLVVVDEASVVRGTERTVVQAAGALLDRLGLDDRVGVIRIPMTRDSRVALTTERPDARDALRQVVGQAVPAAGSASAALAAQQQAQAADQRTTTVVDPDQVTGTERERPLTEAQLAASAAGDDPATVRGILPGLQALLKALQPFPGRKAIALFSAGLPASSASRLDEVAVAAAASHAVIYAFGLQAGHEDAPGAPDLGALERLAKLTGGSYVALGKNADRSVEKIVPELSACYVLGIEGAASDADGKRHALRVDVPKQPQPVTLHVPAWLTAREDVQDVVPAPVRAEVASPPDAPAPGAAAASAGSTSASTRRQPADPAREAELQHLLARAADYVAGYEREYSALVAEENYVQSMRTVRRQLRSDLLLVKLPNTDNWTLFRDVFEVDGFTVRDRQDRLKRLFLDPSVAAQAQLKAIKDESARYNIGLERNINLPLFLLKYLRPENLSRLRFKLSGKQDVAGVEVWRIEYEEQARPTLTYFNQDLPISGWFLVDPVTGALVGTRMEMEYDASRSRAEFEVRYQRDATLGMWVPAEMTESYASRASTNSAWTTGLDAHATYSKFRRFQVKTEEHIKIAK